MRLVPCLLFVISATGLLVGAEPAPVPGVDGSSATSGDAPAPANAADAASCTNGSPDPAYPPSKPPPEPPPEEEYGGKTGLGDPTSEYCESCEEAASGSPAPDSVPSTGGVTQDASVGAATQQPVSMPFGLPHMPGMDGGCCGSGGGNGGRMQMPIGSAGPLRALPKFMLVTWTRGNTGAYPFGDQTHNYDLPLTQSYDSTTGQTEFQLRLPTGGVRPTFTTSDGVTFTALTDRSHCHGATMSMVGSEFVIRGAQGHVWRFPIPAGWSLTQNGITIPVGTIADPLAYPVTCDYDSNGRITATHSLLGSVQFTWGSVSGYQVVTSVTGTDGRLTQYAYGITSHRPRLTAVTHADGSQSTYVYDGTARELPGYSRDFTTRTVTTPNFAPGWARVRTYWSDSIGRVALLEDGMLRDRFWRPANNFTGHLMWRVLQGTGGSLIMPVFNGYPDRVAEVTYGRDGVERFTLDAYKRLVSRTDELGRTTTFTWAGLTQQPSRIDYPDGTFESWVRQPGTSQALAHTDRLGRTTKWERDARGLATLTILPDATPGDDADNPTISTRYNDAAQLVRRVDELGRTTEYRYCLSGQPEDAPATWDAPANHGFLVRIQSPGDAPATSVSTTYRWDAAHQDCTEVVDPGNHTFQWTYDALHRPIRTEWGDGSYATTTYGAPTSAQAGLVLAERDRNGRVTTFGYDASGLRTSVTRPDATQQVTVYDVHGRVSSITDSGDRTAFGYDSAGRQVSKTRQASASVALTTTTGYDSRDRVTSQVDAYGRTTGIVYDINNRPIRTVRGLIPGAVSWSDAQTGPEARLADTTWSSADIGDVGIAGSTTLSGADVVLTAAGKGILSTADALRFHSQYMPGAGSLTVRVDDAATGYAGLMIRDGVAANAAFASIRIHPTDGLKAHYRPRAGASTTMWYMNSYTAPYPRWLRMTRTTQSVTIWVSSDGVAWTAAWLIAMPLGSEARAGVFLASGSQTSTASAQFTNLTLEKTAVLSSVRDAAWAAYLTALPRLSGSNPAYVIEESSYDAHGQITSRTDGRGISTAFAYDARGRLTTMTEGVGVAPATTGYVYDAVGNRTSVTSPRGVVTAQTYTGRNLVASITEAASTAEATVVSTRTYTATGKLETETDALGRVTLYGYGTCCDRLETITDPAGLVTRFSYDAVGNRLSVLDALSQVTSTAYDSRNRAISVINALGQITAYGYDDNLTDGVGLDAPGSPVVGILPELGLGAGADGSATSLTDPVGAVRYEIRDGLGRTVALINPLNQTTRVTYDTVVGGLVETAQTDPLNHVVRARADGAGRVRVQIDAQGNLSTSGFDAAGNQVSQRDALAIGWDASYDARQRLIQRSTTRQDTVVSTTWDYDLDGNQTEEIDALGKTETSHYDARNRRTALIDRLAGITRFAYDAVGNLIQISDADNEPRGGLSNLAGTTQYAYDVRNLLVAEAFPAGQAVAGGRTLRVYGYDSVRRLGSRRVGTLDGAFGPAPAFTGSSVETTYGYDAASRLTVRGYPGDGQNDGFSYDAAGRLETASSARYATTTHRIYDVAGRLTREELTLTQGQLVGTTLVDAVYGVDYTYNADNTLASQTYPTGSVVSRTYTARHELATVAWDGQRVVGRDYDLAGRLVTSSWGPAPGVVTETRSYLAGDHAVASIAIPGVTGFGYTYDAVGRKLTETDAFVTGGGQTFGYDDAGRVTTWIAGAATQSWNLTKVGDWDSTTRNGVTEVRQHSPVHEAVQVGPNILTYDQQGNPTRDEHQTDLAWDPENRLIRARVTPDASPSGFGSAATYRYDALGRRVAKTVDAKTTLYLPAGAQTVVELDLPAQPVNQAAIDGAEADGTLANMALTPASGGILSGSGVTRINFQPSTTAVPAGFIRDTGKSFPAMGQTRTNGLVYGWSADQSAHAVVRHGAVPLPEFDTFVQAQTDPDLTATWSIALPNGYYQVVVVAGDALSRNQSNDLQIADQVELDLTRAAETPTYEAGNFDGYAVVAHVTDGVLIVEPLSSGYHAKLCFVEIGARSESAVPFDTNTTQRLADLVTRANTQTGASPEPVTQTREYAYGDYVDSVVAYQQTTNSVTSRYYPQYNHLYSVAAVTNAAGLVVERFSYDAYGKQKVTDASGNVTRSKSSVGWDRGFTGYITDNETGLLYARSRMYSPTLGRFISRDTKLDSVGYNAQKASQLALGEAYWAVANPPFTAAQFSLITKRFGGHILPPPDMFARTSVYRDSEIIQVYSVLLQNGVDPWGQEETGERPPPPPPPPPGMSMEEWINYMLTVASYAVTGSEFCSIAQVSACDVIWLKMAGIQKKIEQRMADDPEEGEKLRQKFEKLKKKLKEVCPE